MVYTIEATASTADFPPMFVVTKDGLIRHNAKLITDVTDEFVRQLKDQMPLLEINLIIEDERV